MVTPENKEILEALEHIEQRAKADSNGQDPKGKVAEIFEILRQGTNEYNQKRQDFLRYKLYTKFLEESKKIPFEAENGANADNQRKITSERLSGI